MHADLSFSLTTGLDVFLVSIGGVHIRFARAAINDTTIRRAVQSETGRTAHGTRRRTDNTRSRGRRTLSHHSRVTRAPLPAAHSVLSAVELRRRSFVQQNKRIVCALGLVRRSSSSVSRISLAPLPR